MASTFESWDSLSSTEMSSSYIIFIGNKSVGLGNKSVVHISLFLFSLSSNFGTNTISALSSQFLGNFLGWCCFRQQVWILRGRVGPDEENPDNYERVREKNVIIFQIYLMPAVEWFGQSCQKKLTNECDQMAQKCPTFELMIFKKEQKTSQNWTNIQRCTDLQGNWCRNNWSDWIMNFAWSTSTQA